MYTLLLCFRDTTFYAMLSCEDNFKVPVAFTLKRKRIGRFEGLPQFNWNDLGEQDVNRRRVIDKLFECSPNIPRGFITPVNS